MVLRGAASRVRAACYGAGYVQPAHSVYENWCGVEGPDVGDPPLSPRVPMDGRGAVHVTDLPRVILQLDAHDDRVLEHLADIIALSTTPPSSV